jgi:hypothetical protein
MLSKVEIREGERGIWRVERFEIPKNDFRAWQYGYRAPAPGTYTRLLRGNTVVMSDTNAEMRDHYAPVAKARGHCLINGLGIGMVLKACLAKESVERVTVIELSQEVIDLVSPAYINGRVEIIRANALEYQPPKGVRYGMVWHDIWDNICADNLPEMAKLHRKYGRRTDWQGSWARGECERYR